MAKKLKAKVYIDGANMFYAQQKTGWFIDWKKVKQWLEQEFYIGEINYYVGIKKGDEKTNNFRDRLKNYGYHLITKPLKRIRQEDGKFIFKANFDVEIAVDLILDSKQYDTFLLFSGDSDFEYVIKKLQKFSKKVIVCGVERSISHELKKSADRTVLLSSLRNKLEYK